MTQKLLSQEYFHILSHRMRDDNGEINHRRCGPRNTLKYDAWKPVLGLQLGNRPQSGTHCKYRTMRRRGERKSAKIQAKRALSLETE
jgi:hypothetical protein